MYRFNPFRQIGLGPILIYITTVLLYFTDSMVVTWVRGIIIFLYVILFMFMLGGMYMMLKRLNDVSYYHENEDVFKMAGERYGSDYVPTSVWAFLVGIPMIAFMLFFSEELELALFMSVALISKVVYEWADIRFWQIHPELKEKE